MQLIPVVLMLAGLAGSAQAQAPATPAPTTQVLALLNLKPEVPRPELMKTLPEEVKATVKLHLDGKIQQWYGRADGKGVIFVLNCTSVEEAARITADLPFNKAGVASFEYIALTPLSPLRVLVGQ